MQMLRKQLLLSMVLLSFAIAIGAQNISSSQATYSETVFTSTTNFYYQSMSGVTLVGTNSKTGATKCWWSKYDEASSKYLFLKENLTPTSTIAAIVSGDGYQFACANNIDTTYTYCWTFEPKITLDLVRVDTLKTNCTNISLQAITTTTPLTYRNPVKPSETKQVDYKLTYQWIANPVDSANTIPQVWNPEFQQPFENTKYAVTVGTILNPSTLNKAIDTTYKALGMRASLKIVSLSKSYETKLDKVDTIPIIGSTPFTVTFNNTSKGNYTFAEVNISGITDSTEHHKVRDDKSQSFTFDKAGKYKVIMALGNDVTRCPSVYSTDYLVNMHAPFIGIPNTFTPNGDGNNDEFRVDYISLQSFSITIVNRWGRVLYESDNPGQGWDGGDAPTGVYFYSIEATGPDGFNESKTGSIHLFRE